MFICLITSQVLVDVSGMVQMFLSGWVKYNDK